MVVFLVQQLSACVSLLCVSAGGLVVMSLGSRL